MKYLIIENISGDFPYIKSDPYGKPIKYDTFEAAQADVSDPVNSGIVDDENDEN